MSLRVAVIGAGAAGLCAARHILSKPDIFVSPIVFEGTANIGGTWVYEEQAGNYKNGRPIHSSMYQDLRTNLPKEIMMFPDFPFDPELDSFLPHQEVRKYLENYCEFFNITPHIRFKTTVERVKSIVIETENRKCRTEWEVTSSNENGTERTERFDSVFVCSGHYSDPHVPQIPGIQHFKGQMLHSHSYRSPKQFKNKTVMVLGAKASGLDISQELCTTADKVFLSHALCLTFPLPSNLHQVGLVQSIQEDGTVLLTDGAVLHTDVLLFCTGYSYRFPFLNSSELQLQLQKQFVGPLYRLLMPPSFPSLFFIGVSKIILPFPHFHCQVQFALAILSGSISLPPPAVMEAEARQWVEEKLKRGVEQRHLLVLDQDQWEYCSGLASDANFSPIPTAFQHLYDEVWRQRRIHPRLYREINYRILNKTEWETRSELGLTEG